MSTAIVKLVKGTRTLDINDQSKYYLGMDFVPPAVSLEPNFAQGSSANRHGGASLISTRASNRNLSFSVNVRAASYNEMARAVQDIQYMLNLSGDPSEPLYLQYKSHSDVTFEPLWGQDGWLRYQIEYGAVSVGGEYGTANRRATNVNVRIDLIVRPYALGLQQRLASATGGILEDTIGTVDGKSRGSIVPEATTNKMTNPIFGHSTWNNGWSGGTNLIIVQNTDGDFLLPSTSSSAKVTRAANTAGESNFYQTINVGNTNTHVISCYAKRPDSAAITATDLQLNYNGALTTTYVSIGNGWYRLSASVTGINAATTAGVTIATKGITIYLSGFQIEEKSYVTPAAWGDLLGCAWTGTAHASTSTRTAARVRVPITSLDTFDTGQGTIGLVWKAPFTETHPNNLNLWEVSTAAGGLILSLYFNATNNTFVFTDGTSPIESAVQTFAVGDVIVLHAAWGRDGLALYKNGSSIATGSAYTPIASPAYAYIGSNRSAGEQAYGPIMDCRVFDQALTAAQALADYNNITQLTADNQRVGSIPWMWTKDGDDVVDNSDDSTHDSHGVCGGIPGSAPADTLFDITRGGYADSETYVYLSNLSAEVFHYPSNYIFRDLSGSADPDSCGDAYQSQSGSNLTLTAPINSGDIYHEMISGRMFDIFSRMAFTASNVAFTPRFQYGSNASAFAEGKEVTYVGAGACAYRLYRIGSVVVPDKITLFDEVTSFSTVLGFAFAASSASSITLNVDYFVAMPHPLARYHVKDSVTNGAGLLIQGRRSLLYEDGSGDEPLLFPPMIGDVIELVPDRYNILMTAQGTTVSDIDVDGTLTFSAIKVTPRWSLL